MAILGFNFLDRNRDRLQAATIDGIEHYRIDGLEDMDPFLMSVVSDTDLWMFVNSNGGLTAGRQDPDNALFPYCTEDKIEGLVELLRPQGILEMVRTGQVAMLRGTASGIRYTPGTNGHNKEEMVDFPVQEVN